MSDKQTDKLDLQKSCINPFVEININLDLKTFKYYLKVLGEQDFRDRGLIFICLRKNVANVIII